MHSSPLVYICTYGCSSIWYMNMEPSVSPHKLCVPRIRTMSLVPQLLMTCPLRSTLSPSLIQPSSVWLLFLTEMERLKGTKALGFPEQPLMVDQWPLGAQDTQGGKSAQLKKSLGIGHPSNTQHCSTFTAINNLTTTSPRLSPATESLSPGRDTRRHWERLFPGF